MENAYKIAGDILSKSSATQGNFRSVELYGSAVRAQKKDSGHSTFRLENETGTGDITVYQVFPGMELIYNDMHMEYCNKMQNPHTGMIEINYCREGRCECSFGERNYCYMSAGDLSICSLQKGAHTSCFPTSHCHGITVVLALAEITEEMKRILELLSIDLMRIVALSAKQDFYMVRASEMARHIFAELYTVQEHLKPSYTKIKLVELLLMLTELDTDLPKTGYTYISQTQRDRIRKIHDFVVEHMEEHHTIEELADRFELSPTAMKHYFKEVYGSSFYAYFRTYRLQIAERLLRDGRLSIAEIAGKVGYANPNKFTSAFRSVYGMPPTAYQKNVRMDRK